MRLNTRWLSIFGAQLYTATLAFINQLRPGCLWLYSPQSASSAGWTATHFVVLYALVKLAKDYVHYNHRGFSTALVSPERRHGEEYSRPRIHLHFSQHGVNTAHVLKPFTLMGPVHAISIHQPSANRHSSCYFIFLVSIHLSVAVWNASLVWFNKSMNVLELAIIVVQEVEPFNNLSCFLLSSYCSGMEAGCNTGISMWQYNRSIPTTPVIPIMRGWFRGPTFSKSLCGGAPVSTR